MGECLATHIASLFPHYLSSPFDTLSGNTARTAVESWIYARSGQKFDSPRASGASTPVHPPCSGANKGLGAAAGAFGLHRLKLKQDGSAASATAGKSTKKLSRTERIKAAFRRRQAQAQAQAAVAAAEENDAGGAAGARSSEAAMMMMGDDTPVVHLLREDEIISLITDIASGLGFLHDRGVLHLDVSFPSAASLHVIVMNNGD